MIVVRVLRHRPGVKHFIHHQKSHAITQVEKLWRRWIVRSTNRIDTQLPEYFQTSFPNSQRDRGAERASIVMQTHSLEFEVFSVEPEASRSVEVKLTNSETGCFFINDCLVCTHASDCFVEVRVIFIPDRWIRYNDLLLEVDSL